MQKTTSFNRDRLSSGRPNPVDVHVGARLRLRRTLQGLSQETLARALGLTFQQIQKYESGSNRISASRLYDLARILRVSVDYFYEDMAADVVAASPRHMRRGDPGPDLPSVAAVNSRETLDLVRVYSRIQDPSLRRRVQELAGALGRLADRRSGRDSFSPEADATRRLPPDPGE